MMEVHQKLLSLYSALIVAERLTYERIHGRVGSTDKLIQLLLNDPWFTWLCPLLDLLLRIDQLLDDDAFDMTHENVEHLVAEVRALTRPSIEGDGFERAYYEALNRAPEVVLAHFHVTRVLLGGSGLTPSTSSHSASYLSPFFTRHYQAAASGSG